MRVGKKITKTTDIKKKTRSCVVRLEKISPESFSSPNTSPTNIRRTRHSISQQSQSQNRNQREAPQAKNKIVMGATPKQIATGGAGSATTAQSREVKIFKGPIKKGVVSGGGGPIKSNPQTPQPQKPQQQQQQKQSPNMSALRSNQKIKPVPKGVLRGGNTRAATPASKAPTPAREETPTPTIAAGRSRRAIKPNPKYASDDMVTPKMVRNVAAKSQATTGGGGGDTKRRKNSTSSDDFYNRNSDDEYDEDGGRNMYKEAKGDKAYKVDDKEEDSHDSDISELEEEITKVSGKARGRPRAHPQQNSTSINKPNNQTPQSSNVKRLFQTPGSTGTQRTVPTQLQQLRRSLQSANAQRNQNLLAGSGIVAQKRKLAATRDPDESDSDDGGGGGASGVTYTVPRKQMLVTTSSGLRLRMPVKENSSSNTANKPRIVTPGLRVVGNNESRVSLNGGNRTLQTQLIDRKKIIESNKATTSDTTTTNNNRLTIKTLGNRQQQQQTMSAGMAANKSSSTTRTATNTPQTVTVHQKNILGSGVTNINRLTRTSSPKPPLTRKDAGNTSTKTPTNSSGTTTASSSSSQQTQQQQQKKLTTVTKPIDKLKSALQSSVANNNSSASHGPVTKGGATGSKTSSPTSSATQSTSTRVATAASAPPQPSTPISLDDSVVAINDDSPNSTMDDFETMPTFTIVNVNDIINKKGDVLITKSNKGNTSGSTPTVLEISESISLDDEDEEGDGDDEEENENEDGDKGAIRRKSSIKRQTAAAQVPAKLKKSSPQNNKAEQKKKLPLTRSSGGGDAGEDGDVTPMPVKKPSRPLNKPSPPAMGPKTHAVNANKPQILNHRLGLRNNARLAGKTSASVTSTSDKPAPRILNSVVAKKTQPVKPMITNLDDSAEESFPLSLDEEETEDEAESKSFEQEQQAEAENDSSNYPLMDIDDTEDTESQNSDPEEIVVPISKALTPRGQQVKSSTVTKKSPSPAQRKKRLATAAQQNTQTSPVAVTTNKKRILTPIAAKENSLAATNQQVNDTKTSSLSSSPSHITPQTRKQPPEKVVISKQGDKIIKKITCFETWYVINMPMEPKRPTIIKNQLDMPLINLANNAKSIQLPSGLWSCKVTLYELSATTLAKGTFVTYTGDLEEYNISEEDRGKYQPSCVMFRRAIENRQLSRMPYDRAVILKNKTFSTNIEGKNIRLVGAPSIISSERDIEILLEIVDSLNLQSDFVEYATILQ
ncbi:uncharacterized protein [Musca autumnalis]|uniref:uncharacterized protein n=1 Tax=Musca autumnalis TaxID=221902 RepID=UPI003CF56CCB